MGCGCNGHDNSYRIPTSQYVIQDSTYYGCSCQKVKSGQEAVYTCKPQSGYTKAPRTKTSWTESINVGSPITNTIFTEIQSALKNEVSYRKVYELQATAAAVSGSTWINIVKTQSIASNIFIQIRDTINNCRTYDKSTAFSWTANTGSNIKKGQNIFSGIVKNFRDYTHTLQSTCICNCNYICSCNCNNCSCVSNICNCNTRTLKHRCITNKVCPCQCNHSCTCQCNY